MARPLLKTLELNVWLYLYRGKTTAAVSSSTSGSSALALAWRVSESVRELGSAVDEVDVERRSYQMLTAGGEDEDCREEADSATGCWRSTCRTKY